MTQFNAPAAKRSGGEINVYTGLLCAALLILVAGIALVVLANIEHSASPNGGDGGPITLVD